ncbi:alpha/beta hydrolase [Flavivirga aquimarina]|uniref:Alpha/beta hydrolase n=1 Tax=Flavivirga aquimarina TaxID=2027862 RepID=A0ABT8WEQ5_9FLAO|nr:alpha/beta hydrolase [Flavivirga aquimarina]MDO5971528.1 alpha/beta hydrolase [Flavivirga aquimarina]
MNTIFFMKHITYIFLVIAFWSCSNETADDATTENALDASKYYEALNVTYGADEDQKFDLYLPANRSMNTKIMVLVHGGGWSSGDKSDMNLIKGLIQQDFPEIAIVNINYRLADENNQPYPMQIDDITSIINYLKDNDEYYTISNDLGFIGISAGAHLSLLWSYGFDSNKNVDMVCSIVGPTNFTDPAYLNNANPDLQELLDLYGTNPEISYLEETSPYHRATDLSPPTILFYGGQDPLIPTTQGTDMRDKLESLGVTHEFTLYPDAGHGWTGLELLDTWTKLKAFIEIHLN